MLVVGLPGEVHSWNPYTSESALSAPIMDLLYPRLVTERIGDEGLSFEPALARRWEVVDGGRTLVVDLREDARWSDGSALTCEDLTFTLEAQRSDALAWPGVYLKERIERLECEGPHRARVRFSESYPEQLLDLNDDALVPRAYESLPFETWRSTAWEELFVGSGPFLLDEVTSGQGARLVRNDTWWGGETRLEEVVLRTYPDRESALRALLAGGIDVLTAVPPSDARRVEDAPQVELVELPSFTYSAIVWNVLEPGAYTQDRRARACDSEKGCDETVEDIRRLQGERAHPILADARVRRAITLASDRQDLVDGLWMGRARVGGSPIVSALAEHDPASVLPFDPSAAEALLDEAGWSQRDAEGVRVRGGTRLEISVIVNAGNTTRVSALERLASGLERVGISLQVEALPRREFGRRARARDFDGLILGWRAGTRVEPQAILHTRAALDLGNNFGSWSTEESDRLMDEASGERDPLARLELWRAWQALFREEQPMCVLYEERQLVGIASRVRDAAPSPLNPLADLHRWWVDDARSP